MDFWGMKYLRVLYWLLLWSREPRQRSKARRSSRDVETIRWLPLTSLRLGGFEDLNKFGLSTWDFKQDLGLRHSQTNHKVDLTTSTWMDLSVK